jgi:hypothetical protein
MVAAGKPVSCSVVEAFGDNPEAKDLEKVYLSALSGGSASASASAFANATKDVARLWQMTILLY